MQRLRGLRLTLSLSGLLLVGLAFLILLGWAAWAALYHL
ncbi:MAG: hypothetical protein JWN87_2425, partial [Frankiales bacterium]|nr:hypothetical protein [Frankiales bacterium]MDB5876427.1 hypothetical protein [Ramlibacter sp.]